MSHTLDNLKYQIKMARLEQGQALTRIQMNDLVGARGHIKRAQDYLNGRMDK